MKTCGYCNRPLVQRDDEKDSNFNRRETCNPTCGARLREIRKGRK